MTHDELQACTRKQLAEMARRKGIADWHGLRKDDLVVAPGHRGSRAGHLPGNRNTVADLHIAHPDLARGPARDGAPRTEMGVIVSGHGCQVVELPSAE